MMPSLQPDAGGLPAPNHPANARRSMPVLMVADEDQLPFAPKLVLKREGIVCSAGCTPPAAPAAGRAAPLSP
jgi:hypothetical protein